MIKMKILKILKMKITQTLRAKKYTLVKKKNVNSTKVAINVMKLFYALNSTIPSSNIKMNPTWGIISPHDNRILIPWV